jgi:hypothetical protein
LTSIAQEALVACDQPELRRFGLHSPRHGRVDLGRGLMSADVIDAEPSLDRFQETGSFQLLP